MSEEFVTMINWEEMFKDGNLKLHISPKLPTMEFKWNGWNYEIPDLRYLDKVAVELFLNCIKHAGLTKDAEYAEFAVDFDDISREEMQVISDIVLGFNIEAKKRGKNGGHVWSKLLTCSCGLIRYDEKHSVFRIEFTPDHANRIYEYYHDHDLDEMSPIPLCELVDYCVQRNSKEMREWLEKNYEQSC